MIDLCKKLLVIDGYDAQGMALLEQVGATRAGILYKRMLSKYLDEDRIDIADISIGSAFDLDADQYAGICWTGSNLFFSSADDVVQRHIDWCRKFFDLGIPQFGSCWAAQLAAVAAGGKCELNPNGREFGLGRKISLTAEGKKHPMFRGKRQVFDAFESHADIVTKLPENSTLLAENSFSAVQALEVRRGKGVFWAVQYHPEYDFAEIAGLARARQEGLIEQGMFADKASFSQYVDDMDSLHHDNSQADLRWKWAVDDDVINADFRTLEVENWLSYFFG